MASQKTLTMYSTFTDDTSDCWAIVKGALEDQGFATPRPAPAASLVFKPRHARRTALAGEAR